MRAARPLLVTATAAALLLGAACGDDDPVRSSAADATTTTVAQGEPVAGPTTTEAPPTSSAEPPSTATTVPPEPAPEAPPAEQVVTGRVVGVDRDGPSVEVVEVEIRTGADATTAAREAGAIGPDETWDADFFVVEGGRRWIDLAPDADVAVYDCTQACEHVLGELEHVLAGTAPYAGADAVWTFVLGGRAATAVEQLYLP